MNRLSELFARQRVFGDILTVFVIFVGLASMLMTQREVFPNVNFDVLVIRTVFPGATPEEVEKLITNRIEQELKEVDGIKKMNSSSEEGFSEILLQLDPDQTTESKAKDDVKTVIDRLSDLPEDAERPVVIAMESKQGPIIQIALQASSDMTELELREVARKLENRIEELKGVAQVVPRGMQDLEIQVQADVGLLSKFRLSLDELIGGLKRQNVSVPAGSIESDFEPERLVRTTGEFRDPKDVESTVIRANDLGQTIKVRDVAKVQYGLEKKKITNRTNANPSISLTVLKKEKADAIDLVREVKTLTNQVLPGLDPRASVSFVNDLSEFIQRRLSILSGNLIVGLILVLLVLSLILPIRVALLVSIGIPFAFLGTMIWFYSSDVTINLISILGLIIVCGMLVDDAIVVTDNAVRMMEEGMEPTEAAIKGTQQIWPSLTASVFTTIVAFLPMMFMSGIFGKFIKFIPIGVVVALVISLLEAFLILPGHIAAFIRVQKKDPNEKVDQSLNFIRRFLKQSALYWDQKIVPQYTKVLSTFLRKRYWVAFGVGLAFVASLSLAVFGMRFVLFPPEGVEIFFVRTESNEGSSLYQTSEAVMTIETLIAKLPKNEWEHFVTSVGIHQQDPNDPNTKRGSEYAQIAVYLSPENKRNRVAQEIIDDLRTQVGQPKGLSRVTFERVNPGPPVGKPVSIGIRGNDYSDIMKAVEEMKTMVTPIAGVYDVVDSYSDGKEELRIRVRPDEAAAAGLSVVQIGTTVRAAYEGIVATSIQRLDEEVDVRVSLADRQKASAATLGQLLIPNAQGQLIPLNKVATVTKEKSISKYLHQENKREVRVLAELDVAKNSATAVAGIVRGKLDEFLKRHPKVTVNFGGEDEDTQESLQSLVRAFVVAGLGIFLILVMVFQQILQPLLVLLTIPLGIMSVIVTLFLHRMPFSFMAMLGIVALAGVIVNNAIIFIDFINQNRRQGMGETESILSAAKMRVRPIFLTTLTTVFGLLPTAYGIGGLDKFVVPIAMSLGWGLLFGSILTAFLIPTAVAILDDFHAVIRRWRKA